MVVSDVVTVVDVVGVLVPDVVRVTVPVDVALVLVVDVGVEVSEDVSVVDVVCDDVCEVVILVVGVVNRQLLNEPSASDSIAAFTIFTSSAHLLSSRTKPVMVHPTLSFACGL